jgi:hypothetical protein
VLLILDEAQVRPLLPGGGGVALVTSRRRLAGLPTTERLFLDVLTDDDAVGMLERIVDAAPTRPRTPSTSWWRPASSSPRDRTGTGSTTW